jgi:adenine-specific DNA-methyltransferase
LYELRTVEQVRPVSPPAASKKTALKPPAPPVALESAAPNLVVHGECQAACAHLLATGQKIDLVYIDPPFASGANYGKKILLRRHPHASAQVAEGVALEADGWEETLYGDIWNKEDYLNWMFENLTAIKAVMSDTASIYVHLDWHIGHYVKILLDEVFGEENFRNEIVWKRTSARTDSTTFNHIHDVIYYYSKSDDFTFNEAFTEYDAEYIDTAYRSKDEDGRRFTSSDLMAAGLRNGSSGMEWRGINPAARGNHWKFATTKLDELDALGKILWPNKVGGVPRYKRYLDEMKGVPLQSIWDDIFQVGAQAAERVDYATQKPETLLKRIVEASSTPGMVVADFFGGSGVTAKVAHDLGRRFVHTDIGINSIQTARDRLASAGATFDVLRVQDGVQLFRNPQQTMAKLRGLIPGLTRPQTPQALPDYWAGIFASDGAVPVALPNLLDSASRVFDEAALHKLTLEELPKLADWDYPVQKVVVYTIDIADPQACQAWLAEHNPSGIAVELRDLKPLLGDVVLNDECTALVLAPTPEQAHYQVVVQRYHSDYLAGKLAEVTAKKVLQPSAMTSAAGKAKAAALPVGLSADGLECIEWLSLDCTATEGPWCSAVEAKIDVKNRLILNGVRQSSPWDGTLLCPNPPKRLRVRNVAGDEVTVILNG